MPLGVKAALPSPLPARKAKGLSLTPPQCDARANLALPLNCTQWGWGWGTQLLETIPLKIRPAGQLGPKLL